MSATYALLDVAFLAVAAVVGVLAAAVARRRAARAGTVADWRRRTLTTGVVVGVVLLVMTMVFDNVIVLLGVVAYDPARLSGAFIGAIPVEDLAYALAAVVLLPSLWVLLERPRPDGAAQGAVAPARTPTGRKDPR